MNEIILGAVAYDQKVVPIWEGMRSYFRDEAKLPVEITLFLSYEAQVAALLAASPRIDIAWNTNLAYLQCEHWSEGACVPIGMRDTDLGWTTKIIAPRGGAVKTLADLKGKTVALGSRDSGHAAILPRHFLEQEGLTKGSFTELRFDTDVGKHGDTGTSEAEVLRAVLDGRAQAGAVGSPFWAGVLEKKIVPEGALAEVWTSPPFSHCMFTARPGLDEPTRKAFLDALLAMKWENPKHRPILEAEGLKQWLAPTSEGYASLREAAGRQGFFTRHAQ
ncbi:phosphate/phosphite/phosphonate ABC transporter substrate-binding protein [soil metagenome]